MEKLQVLLTIKFKSSFDLKIISGSYDLKILKVTFSLIIEETRFIFKNTLNSRLYFYFI